VYGGCCYEEVGKNTGKAVDGKTWMPE